jgi:branched-chain amino acid transport system ATP-binding protein
LSLLRVERLTVWYESLFGDVRALDRCSLTAEKGAVTCLIGENGAGKSTLFKTVSGVVSEEDGRITGGRILFRGEEITGRSPAAVVSLGLLHAPQGRHVFHTMSVRDNLTLGAYSKRRRVRHEGEAPVRIELEIRSFIRRGRTQALCRPWAEMLTSALSASQQRGGTR